MLDRVKQVGRYLRSSWERLLFGCVGVACLALTFRALVAGEVPAGSALFAMAFFSFFYSNLARFKRFKGLGFEAELWEDKQKEAADLIDRLKSIVSTYTREIVMNNVMRGRFGGETWERRWSLFTDLTGKHTELGQDIDFSPLKHEIDSVFIFDICSPLASSVRRAIEQAKSSADGQLTEKYGMPVTDLAGWEDDRKKLREVRASEDDLFARAAKENIAQSILDLAVRANEKLTAAFSISPVFDPMVLERLAAMAQLIEQRPIIVTAELIEWAQWRDDVQ